MGATKDILMAAPEHATFVDPFRHESYAPTVYGNDVFALDSTHYGALVVQSLHEGLDPPFEARSWYDQVFIKAVSSYQIGHPHLRSSCLSALLMAEKLLIPNIDVFWPHALGRGDNAAIDWVSTGTYYERHSEECRLFLKALAPLILRHPLGRHVNLTAQQFDLAVDQILAICPAPEIPKDREKLLQDDDLLRYVVVLSLLQEVRTVMAYAREHGIPAVTGLINEWPTVKKPPAEDQVLVELYFDHAVLSPRPKNIQDALDLRTNPRIEAWRKTMREWSDSLGKGELTKEEIADGVKDANSKLVKAKFVSEMIPSWSIFVTFPLSTIGMIFGGPIGAVIGGTLLAAEGVNFTGKFVWASLSKSPRSLVAPWYLISEK